MRKLVFLLITFVLPIEAYFHTFINDAGFKIWVEAKDSCGYKFVHRGFDPGNVYIVDLEEDLDLMSIRVCDPSGSYYSSARGPFGYKSAAEWRIVADHENQKLKILSSLDAKTR